MVGLVVESESAAMRMRADQALSQFSDQPAMWKEVIFRFPFFLIHKMIGLYVYLAIKCSLLYFIIDGVFCLNRTCLFNESGWDYRCYLFVKSKYYLLNFPLFLL